MRSALLAIAAFSASAASVAVSVSTASPAYAQVNVAAPSSIAPAKTRAGDEDPPERFFYFGHDYGSQSLFNPIWVILNRGFDVLQLAPHTRNIYSQDFQLNVRNVWDNVKNPFPAISDRGWWRFTREEILPLSYTADSARWTPNYALHLVGGGETYWALREWFLDHEAPEAAATIFSIATMYTAAFINESLENAGTVGFNTDCLADLYVFDSAGIIAYSFLPIQILFSKYVTISDWSLQPAITYPNGDIHNQGNYYSAKLKLPFFPRIGLFGYMGFSNMGGLTYNFDSHYALSIAAGGKVSHISNETQQAVENVVNFKATAGVFVDRNNSLLASFHVADVPDYFLQLNVYPNAFTHLDPGIGMFAIMSKDAHFVAGISLTRSLGFGFGVGSL